jgi:aminoglycoside phosphotransferase (APT) family kinase protein
MLLTVCPGVPVEEKALRHLAETNCALIGRALAAVHAQPAGEFSHLHCYDSAREHLAARLEEVPARVVERDPDGRQAARFIRAALQEEEAAPVLVHGDVLPQNVIHPVPWEEAAPAVIDWEFACVGDPAYDFAILFRGTRKLLGLTAGRRLVTEAYQEAGGAAPSSLRIAAHELTLLLACMGEERGPDGNARQQVGSLCRRLASQERAAGTLVST